MRLEKIVYISLMLFMCAAKPIKEPFSFKYGKTQFQIIPLEKSYVIKGGKKGEETTGGDVDRDGKLDYIVSGGLLPKQVLQRIYTAGLKEWERISKVKRVRNIYRYTEGNIDYIIRSVGTSYNRFSISSPSQNLVEATDSGADGTIDTIFNNRNDMNVQQEYTRILEMGVRGKQIEFKDNKYPVK